MARRASLNSASLGGLIGFWSAGNKPTQDLFRLSRSEIELHLKALYLLSDKVIGAASFFFESPATREVTRDLQVLADTGDLLFFVDEGIDSFVEHGREKMAKSPPRLRAYRSREEVITHGKQLGTISYVLKRPRASLSDAIADLWVADLLDRTPGSLGNALQSLPIPYDQKVLLVDQLAGIARARSKDFVWELVGPKLAKAGLPIWFRRLARRRIAQFYSTVTSELVGASLDRVEHGVGTGRSAVDTELFLHCLRILGVRSVVAHMNGLQLAALKAAPAFILFKEFYFALLRTVGYRSDELARWLPLYRESETRYRMSGLPKEQFLAAFRELARSLGRPARMYSEPLELLLATCDTFQKATIEDFIQILLNKAPAGVDKSAQTTLELELAAFPVMVGNELALASGADERRELLGLIKRAVHTFEAAPNTYINLSEEELRNVILMPLAAWKGGLAVGEAFHKRGKTDILAQGEIRTELIVECKVWSGQKGFQEACDQLLGYLTWRDRSAALVIFNKTVADLGELMRKIPEAATTHHAFQAVLPTPGEGEWEFIFASEETNFQKVFVRIFLVNLLLPKSE